MKTASLVLLALGTAQVANAQAPAPNANDVKIVVTKLGGDVYGIDGQGGRMAALVGQDGVFLVDSQFARVSDKIAAALHKVTRAPFKFLVNTHVHGDHTGGNENFAKMGVTILGRPEVREQLLHPRPAPGNGQIPPVAPPAALPTVLYDDPVTIHMDGETVDLIPLPPAHTNGDTAVKFEKADVLMTGDVFRSQGFPAAAVTNGGSVLGTLEALNRMIAYTDANTKVVPGHGPVADQAALIAHRDLIVTVRDRIEKMMKEGKTADEIRASKPTADFEAKVGGPPAFIPQFVNALIDELGAANR